MNYVNSFREQFLRGYFDYVLLEFLSRSHARNVFFGTTQVPFIHTMCSNLLFSNYASTEKVLLIIKFATFDDKY